MGERKWIEVKREGHGSGPWVMVAPVDARGNEHAPVAVDRSVLRDAPDSERVAELEGKDAQLRAENDRLWREVKCLRGKLAACTGVQAEWDDESYQRFLAEAASECDCCRSCGATVPCGGVTAGGLCDGLCFCGLDDDDFDDEEPGR